jgi:LysR family glycine cleavage system transcriptional activator
MVNRAGAPFKLPPLRALQSFEAIARTGSVASAALELGVSSGAISQQLRKIEDSLDLRLFDRRGKGIELNSFGRLYVAELTPAFDQLRRAQEKLWRAKTEGRLVLSCLSSVSSRWIGPQLLDWQAAHPMKKIRIIGAETEPELKRDLVDFRITYGHAVRNFEHHMELFTDWVVPVCAPALLQSHRVTVPSDLLNLPLIVIEWDPSYGSAAPDWNEWALSIGVKSRPRTLSDLAYSQSSAAIEAAINGRGVVLAQMSFIAEDLASGRLVAPIDHRLALPQPYFLAWDRTALQKTHGHDFRSWLMAVGKRQAQASIGPLPPFSHNVVQTPMSQ